MQQGEGGLSPLKTKIINLIQQTGPVTMAEFMNIALSDPDYGYYKTREPFGTKGDFITAPEISQMFGELIGIWCADIWLKMGSPYIEIVEMGPGRGTLMADLLRGTKKIPSFHDKISISMVETSNRLQEIQKEKLQELHPRINWFEDIADVPDKPLIIVTNELFDALPVNQYVFREGEWHENMLGLDGRGELAFMLLPAGSHNHQEEGCLHYIREGAIIEICPLASAIINNITNRFKKHGGAALIIDYGYTKRPYQNTISAITNHKHSNILENIGSADLSAHVDFSFLRRMAENASMDVYGAVCQGDFLRNMGIEQRAEQLGKNATEKQKHDIESARNRLTGCNEGEMGELFKVLAITSGIVPEGF